MVESITEVNPVRNDWGNQVYYDAYAVSSVVATAGIATLGPHAQVMRDSAAQRDAYYQNVLQSSSKPSDGMGYKGNTYSGTRDPSADFIHGKKLAEHADRHSALLNESGINVSTETQYQQAAQDFFSKTPTDTTFSFTSEEGAYFQYDTMTGEFGIINPYGGISTYFIPDEGIDYWLRQIELYGYFPW